MKPCMLHETMPCPLYALFLLFLLLTEAIPTLAERTEEQFFIDCPPFHCGSGSGSESVKVRFPFRLVTSPVSCGLHGLELSCSGNDTLLTLPSSPPLKVTFIGYRYGGISVHLGSLSEALCPLENPLVHHLTTSIYAPLRNISIVLMNCSRKFPLDSDPDLYYDIGGPVSCLSGSDYFVYAVRGYLYMDMIPSYCMVVPGGGMMPFHIYPNNTQTTLRWTGAETCRECESAGKLCGYNWETNQTFCQRHSHHASNVMLIIGTSVGGLVILALVFIILLCLYRKSEMENAMGLKVERFLATYRTTNPTRYTYSAIKKITKRFRHKLGQGGFGSVYKGELACGIPVAVKMLEKSKGEGEEFINEVATIGRIHHANIVRLLGFYSEGTRHALIYEYMPNESLEKYIFSKENRRTDQPLSMEKLQEIAISIARGIEYLHQGCDQRILHFDIKPHNILLDHNFNPKISDFGLAKLCSRDQSIVTMTAARGTMGYIAPELYSRNFGTVSYKSDVYSFGMLLMEMVSGKKNIDPKIEDQSDVYFPEWIYNKLIQNEDLAIAVEKKEEEEETVKKLLIVALWCIQWNPIDRPSMTRVIQLLMGNLESLQIPPKPFVSSYQNSGTSVDAEMLSIYSA